MADSEKDWVETLPRGNDWEVVSLTASAYAASPGARGIEEGEGGRHEKLTEVRQEYARALFMSEHFVFPPCEHENLPLVSDEDLSAGSLKNIPGDVDQHFQQELLHSPEIHDESGSEVVEHMEVHKLGSGEWETVRRTDEHSRSSKIQKSVRGFAESNAFHGISFIDEKETDGSGSTTFNENDLIEAALLNEPKDSASQVDFPSDSPGLSKPMEEKNGSGLPCESWWKKQAASLYAQAREANAFWSVFIAATLMGLAILGHRWQQEKLHIQQLKWQLSLGDEKLGRMLASVSRFKDALIGQRRVPALRHTNVVEQ